ADVEQVTYHLPPTHADANPVARESKENGFALTTKAGDSFTARATVRFQDGSSLELETPVRLTDQAPADLRLTNTSRVLGPDAGGTVFYNWTASVQGPAERLRQIQSVRYFLHPTF